MPNTSRVDRKSWRLLHRESRLVVVALWGLAASACKGDAPQPFEERATSAGSAGVPGGGATSGGNGGSPGSSPAAGVAGTMSAAAGAFQDRAGAPNGASGNGASLPEAGAGGRGGATHWGPGGGGPVATGSECASDDMCASQDLCVFDVGAHVSVCRPRCLIADAGRRGSCEEGQVCTLDSSLAQASCHDLCGSEALSPGGCPGQDACRLLPERELTGGGAIDGICVRLGSQLEGQRCTEGDCSEGLECVGAAEGLGVCAPYCVAGGSSDGPGSCASDEECVEVGEGRGGCVQSCELFVEEACPGELACVPALAAGEMIGRCVAQGERERGEECQSGDCQAGLVCTRSPSLFGPPNPTCEPLCAAGESGVCSDGECLQAPRLPTGVGACYATCAFGEATASAGCGVEQWCAPGAVAADVGNCVPVLGTASAGEACVSDAECAAGLLCDCPSSAAGACASEATCQAICGLGASPEAAAGCPAGQTCVPEVHGGTLRPYGICREVCGAGSCAEPAETCSRAVAEDACLDIPLPSLQIGQPCSPPAFQLHDRCGATAICEFDPAVSQIVCAELCRVAQGEIGVEGHPDCNDPNATCEEITADLPFGFCIGDGS